MSPAPTKLATSHLPSGKVPAVALMLDGAEPLGAGFGAVAGEFGPVAGTGTPSARAVA